VLFLFVCCELLAHIDSGMKYSTSLSLVAIAPFLPAEATKRKPWKHQRAFPLKSSASFTIDNMTCTHFKQPLNHFVSIGKSPSYLQRYCLYDGFMTNLTTDPIFLYTGNESPLEQYINNTGLIWELAPTFQAQVAFFEHRYEGESLPRNISNDCMSYASSQQALADFVTLLDFLNPQSKRPVIAFGGSYGGMLSSWLRMKYPDMIAGAIAASAPIWGFPRNRPTAIDTAWTVVTTGLTLSFPPTLETRKDNHCVENLQAAWPLIMFLGETQQGRDELAKAFRLCDPLEDMDSVLQLLEWAQSPWFDLAESSFPYSSSYITFALHMGLNDLPAWPLQAACWNVSHLHQEWGIQINGNREATAVKHSIKYGDSGLVLDVDWNNVSVHDASSWSYSETIVGLLSSVRDAVGIWFNVSHNLGCFNITPAINMNAKEWENISVDYNQVTETSKSQSLRRVERKKGADDAQKCLEKMKAEGSWNSLCCNEDMNIIITDARGLGHDMFWPPSFPRGTETYNDIIHDYSVDWCIDPDGIFGYPQVHDPWSTWLDLYYGGLRIGSHSNIVFSNGLLDPWSAAGVYADEIPPSTGYDGPMVQNITTDGSMIALIIEFGGHHTDLMYSDPLDPGCVVKAREIERLHIKKWIEGWHGGKASLTCSRD